MIPGFAEGVQSIALPCSLVLLVPVVTAAVAVGGRPVLATTLAVLGAVVAMWLRAAGLVPDAVASVGAVVLALFTVATVLVWLRRSGTVTPGVAALAAGPGLLAGWIWQPCVGAELGGILTAAGERAPGSVFGMAAYAAGVLLPAIVIALLRVAVGRTDRLPRPVAVAGSALGVALAGLVLIGRDDQVIGWLVRLSV